MSLPGKGEAINICLSVMHGGNLIAYHGNDFTGTSTRDPSPESRSGQVRSYGISAPTNWRHSSHVRLRQTCLHTISVRVSVRAIQMRIVLSSLPEASRCASGLKATAQT